MSDVILAKERRDLDEASSKFASWLKSKIPEATDITVQNVAYPFGAGMSHETILLDAIIDRGGRQETKGLVFRVKPRAHQVFPFQLWEEQIGLMRALRRDGRVKVAEIFWKEDDPSLLGAPFFVMEKLKGRVPVTVPVYSQEGWVVDATPAQRRKLWESAVRALATLQRVPHEGLEFLSAQDDGRKGLIQEWERYKVLFNQISEERRWPLFEAAMEKLEKTWPKNDGPGLVWGDARIGNMMFDENYEVMAVMDWEQPSLGGALHDLSWFLYMSRHYHGPTAKMPLLEGFGTREETLALWREVSGCSTADLDWYEGFTLFKLALLTRRMDQLAGVPAPTEAWPEHPMPMWRDLASYLEIPWGG